MLASDVVQLAIDEEDLDPLVSRWVRYSFRTEVGVVPGSGEIALSPLSDPQARTVYNKIRAGSRVSVLVGGVVRSTGVATGVVREASAGRAPTATWTIKDVLARPFKSDIMPGFSPAGLTALVAVERLLRPWGIQVEATNAANRVICGTRLVQTTRPLSTDRVRRDDEMARAAAERGDWSAYNAIMTHRGQVAGGSTDPTTTEAYQRALADAASSGVSVRCQKIEHRNLVPTPGTQISRWLPEYLREVGLMIWASAAGKAILSAPDYDQAASMVVGYDRSRTGLLEGNITQSSCDDSTGEQVTSCVVAGRIGDHGQEKAKASAVDEQLWDRGIKVYRYISDRKLRDLDAARARAEQTIREAQLDSWHYRCTVSGHGVGDAMAAADTMVDVRDPLLGVERLLYCRAVDFRFDGSAPTVQMDLILPGLWGAGAYAEGAAGQP